MHIPEELQKIWDVRWDMYFGDKNPGPENDYRFWHWWFNTGAAEHSNIAPHLSPAARAAEAEAAREYNFKPGQATAKSDFYQLQFKSSTQSKPGVNVVGYAKSEMGIGEVCRSTALSLVQAGIPISVFNITTGNNNLDRDLTLAPYLTDTIDRRLQILCLSPIDTKVLYARGGPKFFEDRYRIGFWTWELDRWPQEWGDLFNLVDEVWSISHHSTLGMFNQLDHLNRTIPIRVMPLCVEIPESVRADRKKFGLPEDGFLFHFAFDPHSFARRKNPHAVIRCFRRLAAEFPNVHLVLKLNSWKPELLDTELFDLITKTDRLILKHETLNRVDNLSLLASCDSHVSLHRAEGFGLMMAESMLLRKPVIATRYSGNLEFCTPQTADLVSATKIGIKKGEYHFSEGLEWAEPSEEEAYQAMRNLIVNGPKPGQLDAAHALVSKKFSRTQCGNMYSERLSEITRLLETRESDPNP